MISGLAIVAPDQPNIREILVHKQTGLLFDPNKDQSLEKTITELSNDPILLNRLGQAAKQTIYTQKFTWDDNAKRIVALATNLLKR